MAMIWSLLLFASLVRAQRAVVAGDVPAAAQDYDFSSEHRCRILAHSSVELKKDEHNHILVIDGGFGSFSTKVNGTLVRVLDLNGWTVAFDLSKSFLTPEIEPLWMYKKPHGKSTPPVTNHGGIWYSDDQSTIWYQGGHLYNSSDWTSSLYHVDKADIPPWEVWQMDVSKETQGWKNVTDQIKGHELANRTFAGGAVSIPKEKKSFWLGGLIDPTTASTTPNETLETTDQFLIMDHSTNTVERKKYFHEQSTKGQFQGDLVHLPIGPNAGYIMSLMSLERPIDAPWIDTDGPNLNGELGDPVTLASIPMYDVEADTWFEQKTSWMNNEIPEPRTRFCTALFHNEKDNTWDLWIHGGQQLDDQNTGVRDVFVLSMPSFTWFKVDTTIPDTNLIRSHTCHAIGGQLLIVGGYPPGLQVPTNATCDSEYIKVLDISEDGVAWTGSYRTDSVYRSPQIMRDYISKTKKPYFGFADARLESNFNYKTPSSTGNLRAIAAGVIGGVAGLIAVGVLVWWLRKRKAQKQARGDSEARSGTSPSHGQLEVLKEVGSPVRHQQDQRPQHPTLNVTEVRQSAPRVTHELESPTQETQRYGNLA